MADLEGSYYQGVDPQPDVRSPPRGACAALIPGGLFLMAMALAATFFSSAALPISSSSVPTRLAGNLAYQPHMSRASAPSRAGVVNGAVGKLQTFGIQPSQLEWAAIAAIDQNDRVNRRRGRGVSVRAEAEGSEEGLLNELTSQPTAEPGTLGRETMDQLTKERLRGLGKEIKLKAQDMAGVTDPVGFFDPLGFSTDCSTGKLLFYREVELKHGRVAMLASLGILVAEQFHPLFGGDIDAPAYVAFQQTPLQKFWPAVLAAISIPEVFSFFTFESPFGDPLDKRVGWWSIKEYHQPGDLGFDPLGLKPTDPKELKEMQTKELNNGRLAMIAAAGMIAQELATGKKLF
jgi:hypothetical protein